MEYLAGGSLPAPTRPLAPALRVRAVGDAARALSALHLAGIVHAAVKPANVLIDPYGAKLADPDLSQLVWPGQRYPGVGPTTGIEFTDPALLLGEPPVPAHDVWSVGLLLHWVVTGSSGYDGMPRWDGLAALRRVIAGRPRLAEDLPGPVAGIVRACLAPPADRPAAAVVADRVAAVAADMAADGLAAATADTVPAMAPAPG
jgi:serine/threonine protein kinase